MRTRAAFYALTALVLCGAATAANHDWLQKVSARDRNRPNPLANDSSAARAGAKIFAEHCAPCHGAEGEGKVQGKSYRPNLHSDRIKQATPGELFWILTNGSLKKGMPSWSRFPEPMRWQVVTYLKSLP